MSILTNIHKGKRIKPRRTILFGPHGIGKSTWASKWPSPLFLDLEGGVNDLDVESIRIKSAMDVYGAVIELPSIDDLPYRTVVIDSSDWLEKLAWEHLCREADKPSIADFGFGTGYRKSSAFFAKVLSALDQVIEKGLHVLFLAHSTQTKVEPPDGESYHKYAPKLHEQTSSLIQEWADEVLLCNYKVMTIKKDEGFKKERHIVTKQADRVIHTSERPGWYAKNRLGLPEEMTMDFSEYEPFLNRKAK
jgi:hypothetical protein